jgi:hypothetical protein
MQAGHRNCGLVISIPLIISTPMKGPMRVVLGYFAALVPHVKMELTPLHDNWWWSATSTYDRLTSVA